MRRKLGNVNMELQENKAINLALSAPKISGIIIKPGETFSFWKLVGRCLEKDGIYRNGKVYREKNDCRTGICLSKELIRINHAKVCYDTSNLDVIDMIK